MPGQSGSRGSTQSVPPQGALLKRFPAIILDVNGTLLGYEDPHGFEKRFASACRDLGEPVTAAQVHEALTNLVEEWVQIRRQGIRRASSGEQYRRTMAWGSMVTQNRKRGRCTSDSSCRRGSCPPSAMPDQPWRG